MPVEAGHIQLLEYNKEVIPELNYMMEDLFCRYGVSIPYYLLDFSFPDYPLAERPAPYEPEWLELYRPSLPPWPMMQWPEFDWFPQFNGFNFNMDWGEWGYNLPWFNELLGLLFDEADIPRWEMPDFSKKSIAILNDYIHLLYGGLVVAPVTEFSANLTTGVTSLTVTFTDESTNTPTSWLWDFGDGDTSTDQNPAHEFSEGTYTVALTATNTAGSDTETKIDYILVYINSEAGDNQILRTASDTVYANMITEFEGDPGYSYDESNEISVSWYYRRVGSYHDFYARQGYRTFDTTSFSGVTAAKISLGTINEILITAGAEDPILEIYQYDYGDSLTWQADWTGGTKIAERTFTAADDGTVVQITIDPSYINAGGMSKYRFSMKRITDSNYWAEDSTKRHRIVTGVPRLLLKF